RHYVRTSWENNDLSDPLYRAVLRLAQASWQPAIDVIDGVHRAWGDLIREEVGDDALADAIMLIGEGLYYHAAMPGALVRGTFNPAIDALLAVVDRLKAASPHSIPTKETSP